MNVRCIISLWICVLYTICKYKTQQCVKETVRCTYQGGSGDGRECRLWQIGGDMSTPNPAEPPGSPVNSGQQTTLSSWHVNLDDVPTFKRILVTSQHTVESKMAWSNRSSSKEMEFLVMSLLWLNCLIRVLKTTMSLKTWFCYFLYFSQHCLWSVEKK